MEHLTRLFFNAAVVTAGADAGALAGKEGAGGTRLDLLPHLAVLPGEIDTLMVVG